MQQTYIRVCKDTVPTAKLKQIQMSDYSTVPNGEFCGTKAAVFFLIRLVGGGVQLGPLGMAATDWPTAACPG
jgi:hypothetical protein